MSWSLNKIVSENWGGGEGVGLMSVIHFLFALLLQMILVNVFVDLVG